MAKIKVGILHSLQGTMAVSESPLVDAAIMAIEEINAQGGVLGHRVEAIIEDGASDPKVFEERAQKLLHGDKVSTLFGCWTSASRKAVKPLVEAAGALLWYPVQYEGLEESPNIVYTGSCLNQQIEPAVNWMLQKGKKRCLLIGSDYVFPRTANLLIASMVEGSEGTVLADRYVPLGGQEFSSIVKEIGSLRPDVIFNTLNGDSNYAFFRQLHSAGLKAEEVPVMSFSMAEGEQQVIAAEGEGHYACWSYFQTLDSKENRDFIERYQHRYGSDRHSSDPIVAAYSQVWLWRNAVEAAGSFNPHDLRQNLAGQRYTGPAGEIQIQPNHHLTKSAFIGRAREDGLFDLVWQSKSPIKPKPWLGVEDLSLAATPLIKESLRQFPQSVHYTTILEDEITQRKKVEDEFRLYEEIIKNIAEGIYLVSKEDLTILYANPKFLEMFGYKGDELIGKHVSIINAPTKEDPVETALNIESALKKEGLWQGELINIKKDGATFWCNSIISNFSHKEYGQVYLSIQSDISERKEAEKELRKKEQLLRSISESYPAYLSIIEKDFTIGYTAGREFTKQNLDPNDFIGLKIEDIFGEHAPFVREQYMKVFEGEIVTFDLNINNEYQHYYATPLYNAEREVDRVLVVVSNITERKKAEKALKESEELHRLTLSNISDAVFITDEAGRFSFICPNVNVIFGYSFDEVSDFGNIAKLLGSNFFDIKELKERGEIPNIELTIIDKSGNEHSLLVTVKRVSIKGGTVLYTCRDITERKQAEEALRESKQLLSNVFESMQEGVLVLNSDFKYRYFNRTLEEISHTQREDVLGKIPWKVYPFLKGNIEKAMKKAMKGEISRNIELEYSLSNGKEGWTTESYFPLKDAKEKIVGVIGVIEDITERKQTEEELDHYRDHLEELVYERTAELNTAKEEAEASEHWFRVVFESVGDGLIANKILPDGSPGPFEHVNLAWCEKLGYSKDELSKMSPVDVEDPEIGEQVISEAMKSLEKKGSAVFQTLEVRKDGSKLPVEVNARVVPFRGERYIFSVVRDISKRKRAEAELTSAKEAAEAANKAKSLFLANMSHELRTPLNAILGFSEMLTRDSEASEIQKEKLSIINRSGEHLLNMINDVLDLSKIEAGRVEPELETFDLPLMLKDLGKMFELRAESAGLIFELALDQSLAHYIKTDAGKLRQVLINLLGNAVNFTQEGGISLRAKTSSIEGDPRKIMLQLEVRDSGVGIASKEMESIFEPFVQTKQVLTESRGTGLGLSITKSFIDLLGGEISVESQPGKGSLFQVKLPVTMAEKSEVSHIMKIRPAVKGLAPSQHSRRILVVEDNSDNRLLLVSILKQAGFDIKEAENGKEAVTLFEKWQPNFIWMDMRMPVMDGYDATKKIRKLPGGDSVKIVAITASALKEQHKRILAAGCDRVMHKPFQSYEIFDVMSEQLGIRYIYEEESKEGLKEAEITLNGEMMGALSDDLRKALREATHNLNISATGEVIDLIHNKHPEIAKGLQLLAKEFRFDRILEMLSEVKKNDH